MAKGWAEGGWNGDSWSEGSDPWRGKSQGKAETKHTGSINPGMEENSLRFKALLDSFDRDEWYRWGGSYWSSNGQLLAVSATTHM